MKEKKHINWHAVSWCVYGLKKDLWKHFIINLIYADQRNLKEAKANILISGQLITPSFTMY